MAARRVGAKRDEEMTRFKIYAVRQRWRKGSPLAWLVNYGEPDQGGKWRRKQTMFSTQARAEEFLELVKREILVEGELRFGKDPVLRRDAMRAAKLVSEAGLPSGSLTVGVQLLLECRSSQEKRGGFLEPIDRWIELSPRSYLGLVNEAREGGLRLSDLVEGIMWKHIEERSRRRAEEELEQKWKRNRK